MEGIVQLVDDGSQVVPVGSEKGCNRIGADHGHGAFWVAALEGDAALAYEAELFRGEPADAVAGKTEASGADLAGVVAMRSDHEGVTGLGGALPEVAALAAWDALGLVEEDDRPGGELMWDGFVFGEIVMGGAGEAEPEGAEVGAFAPTLASDKLQHDASAPEVLFGGVEVDIGHDGGGPVLGVEFAEGVLAEV